jgi:intraflagellar transport protein 74
MESLRAEHKKRQRELELLKTSEPKFMKELSSLKETIRRMRGEIEEFSDIDGLRRRYDKTQGKLQDLKRSYIKRRDAMRAQVQSVSAENESLKRSLAGNDTFKDLEDTEKRLKQYERTIFELKEFVETKSRETNYEPLKGSCLKVGDALNAIAIKKSLDNLGASARK